MNEILTECLGLSPHLFISLTSWAMFINSHDKHIPPRAKSAAEVSASERFLPWTGKRTVDKLPDKRVPGGKTNKSGRDRWPLTRAAILVARVCQPRKAGLRRGNKQSQATVLHRGCASLTRHGAGVSCASCSLTAPGSTEASSRLGQK